MRWSLNDPRSLNGHPQMWDGRKFGVMKHLSLHTQFVENIKQISITEYYHRLFHWLKPWVLRQGTKESLFQIFLHGWNWREAEFSSQNMPLWYKDYLGWLFFRKQTQEKLWKHSRRLPFSKRHLHLQGKSPFVRVCPRLYQEYEGGV